MTYLITLPESLKNQIIEHAKLDLPNECCGYITGVGNSCQTLYKMTNVESAPDYFEFDPKEQLHVIKTARRFGEVPIVVYHSHPNSPAQLSKKDLDLLNDPSMVYLIISLIDHCIDLKAFRIINKKIYDVTIQTTEESYVS